MSMQDLREKSEAELKLELIELSKTKFENRLSFSINKLEKTHKLKLVRRNIARVKTILNERSGA